MTQKLSKETIAIANISAGIYKTMKESGIPDDLVTSVGLILSMTGLNKGMNYERQSLHVKQPLLNDQIHAEGLILAGPDRLFEYLAVLLGFVNVAYGFQKPGKTDRTT